MAKYEKLTEWLRNPTLILTFSEIENIIGDKLPESALRYRPWWGNEKGAESRQCRAWLDAGWEVGEVDLKRKMVLFKRGGRMIANDLHLFLLSHRSNEIKTSSYDE